MGIGYAKPCLERHWAITCIYASRFMELSNVDDWLWVLGMVKRCSDFLVSKDSRIDIVHARRPPGRLYWIEALQSSGEGKAVEADVHFQLYI